MSSLNDYIEKRGITEEEMQAARVRTQAVVDAYALREARKSRNMTQTELARKMGVSQNRISRMESGEISSMSVDTVRRYIEALDGEIALTAKLPGKTIRLA